MEGNESPLGESKQGTPISVESSPQTEKESVDRLVAFIKGDISLWVSGDYVKPGLAELKRVEGVFNSQPQLEWTLARTHGFSSSRINREDIAAQIEIYTVLADTIQTGMPITRKQSQVIFDFITDVRDGTQKALEETYRKANELRIDTDYEHVFAAQREFLAAQTALFELEGLNGLSDQIPKAYAFIKSKLEGAERIYKNSELCNLDSTAAKLEDQSDLISRISAIYDAYKDAHKNPSEQRPLPEQVA